MTWRQRLRVLMATVRMLVRGFVERNVCHNTDRSVARALYLERRQAAKEACFACLQRRAATYFRDRYYADEGDGHTGWVHIPPKEAGGAQYMVDPCRAWRIRNRQYPEPGKTMPLECACFHCGADTTLDKVVEREERKKHSGGYRPRLVLYCRGCAEKLGLKNAAEAAEGSV